MKVIRYYPRPIPKRKDDEGWSHLKTHRLNVRDWYNKQQRQTGELPAANTHGTIGRRGRKVLKYNRAKEKEQSRA